MPVAEVADGDQLLGRLRQVAPVVVVQVHGMTQLLKRVQLTQVVAVVDHVLVLLLLRVAVAAREL
jgi:hypothetical protein